jgi:hypothetical protein
MIVGAFLSTLAIALAYGAAFLPGGPPAWAVLLMVVGVAGLVVTTMGLGALRRARGRTWIVASLVFTFVALVTGFALALWLPADESAASAMVLGFPARASAVFYIVGVLPLVVLPIVYVLTFDSATLTAADLERVRAARHPLPDAERRSR